MLNIQEVLRLLKCFPNSFVNTNGDFINVKVRKILGLSQVYE